MSKKKKSNENGLYVIDTIDNMDRDGYHTSEPMTQEEAEARYNALTKNGTKNTSKDRQAITYYVLRLLPKAK